MSGELESDIESQLLAAEQFWLVNFNELNRILFLRRSWLEGTLARHPLLSRIVAGDHIFEVICVRSSRLNKQVCEFKNDVDDRADDRKLNRLN